MHLSPGELLGAAAGTLIDPAAVAHLATCLECQAKVSELKEADQLFAPLRIPGPPPNTHPSAPHPSAPHPSAPHPSEEDLANFAAGIDSPGILDHLIACARCAAIVSTAAEDAEPETTVLTKSATRGWRTEMASTFRKEAKRNQPSPYRTWLAIAATLILTVAIFGVWRRLNPDPAQLLAKAYTEARPFEFRLADDGYAELHIQKGANSASDSIALLDARPLIRRQLESHPSDPALKALSGRAQLLERNFEGAIQDLNEAHQGLPEDPAILTDLAVAYAARGQQERRNSDLPQAMQYLLQALSRNPNPEITQRALFNLGLIQQDLAQMDQAVETWRRFLALKPNAPKPNEGWRREAQRHLDEILQLLDRKKKADSEMYQSPQQFLATHVPGQAFDPLPYFETFWINWMPAVRTEALQNQTGPAINAATLVARGFADRGEWSLLETVQKAKFDKAGGLDLLAQAARGNRGLGTPADKPVVAAPVAVEILSREHLNEAANVARLEVAFTNRRASQLSTCLAALEAPLRLSPDRYKWLVGVAHLEHVSCIISVGQEGAARAETETAFLNLTRDHIWPIAMRAAVYLAGIDARIGNYVPVWDTVPDSLKEYWLKPTSFYRLQGFFDHLASSSVAAGWQETALLMAQGAAAAARRQGDAGMEASNYATAAGLLLQLGRYQEALSEWSHADQLLATLAPDNPVRPALTWSAQVGRAEIESELPPQPGLVGRIEALLATSAGHDTADLRRLHQALGLTLLAAGRIQDAATALRQAIDINQKSAATLSTWVERVSLVESAARAYSTLSDIELRYSHNPAAALETWHRYRPRPTAAQDGQWVTLAALPSGLVVFSEGGAGITARPVGSKIPELHALADTFARLCANRTSDLRSLNVLGTRLYQSLLAPELSRLQPGTVRISAEPWLAAIPFESLRTPQGDWLRERFSFVQDYGPARSNPAIHPLAAEPLTAKPLIIAVPQGRIPGHAAPLPPLPDAATEAARIAARLKTLPLADTSKLSTQISRATLFHFTGHGWANGGHGALLLPPGADGQPAYLGSRDIAKQDLSRCQLAVLSACLTAAGEQRGVVNSQSLVQAFLSAGAAQVLAARWSVDSAATKALMEAFYTHLLTGETPATSLLAAEQTIARDPRWAHPYYWAGFSLFGATSNYKEGKTL